jgi:prepilin-type N-terminal cleavage/methylation domain-containing protein
MVEDVGTVDPPDAGFTLVELMVTIGLLAVIGTLVTSAMINGLRQQTVITARITTVNDLRGVMERVTRDVRNGTTVLAARDDSLTIRQVGPVRTRVLTYALRTFASERSLVLDETVLDASGTTIATPPEKVVIAHVPTSTATPFFLYDAAASYAPPAGSGVDPSTCYVAGSSPPSFSPSCIGSVTVHLFAKVPRVGATIDLRDTVELRNL